MSVPELSDAAKTLLIPLWCRAKCALDYPMLGVGASDAEVLRSLSADFSEARRSDCVLYAMRELLLRDAACAHLAEAPRAAIVDVGCGLDTLARSLGTSANARYYVDLPEVIELREQLIPRVTGETYIAADVCDFAFLKSIIAPEGAVFIMGGLLCHLERERVAALLKAIAAAFPGCGMAFDGLSAAAKVLDGNIAASSLPGPARLARECGIDIHAVRRLPVECAALPFGVRARLVLLLRSGALRFYSALA